MKKIKLLLWLSLMMSSIALGQTLQITGKVTSSVDGGPLPGVTVVPKGTILGTVTTADGKYSLSVPSEITTLQFSYLGYKMQEVEIGGRTKIDLILTPDVISIDEIVILAYGTAKKSTYTGSTARIDGKKLETRPVTNITMAIEGSNPGIQVSSANGQPGSAQGLRIRGIGSVSASNSPLFIVDGINYTGYNIGNLNSQDIESISVLKDAASTAMYGNKAANGVVIVTTRKGSKDRNTIQLNVSQGFTTRSIPQYDRVNAFQYYPLMWESNRNSQLVFPNPTDPSLPTAAAYATASQNSTNNLKTIVGYNILNVPDNQIVDINGQLNPAAQILGTYGEDLDWEKELMKKGRRQEYGLTYSGGSERSDYFVSLGYLNEKGFVIKSDLQRFTGRININSQATKWLRTGLNISGMTTKSNQARENIVWNNPFYFTRNMGPIYPVYAHDPITGEYLTDPATGGKVYDLGNNPGLPVRPAGAAYFNNIIAVTLWNEILSGQNSISARAFAEISFLKDFKFTFNAGSEITTLNGSNYLNKNVGNGSPAGYSDRSNQTSSSYTINELLNYSKTIGRHSMAMLFGHENYDYKYSSLYGARQGVIADGNTELINFTTTNSLSSFAREYKTEGFFSRLDYNFNSRYFFSASIRRDGSSRFAPSSRWGNFWSVSGAWRLDQEKFIKDIPIINHLKLRSSYGAVGNDEGLDFYAYQALYTLGINNANEAGVLLYSSENESLTWESNLQFDVAIEYTLFKTITGSLEFYHRGTSDLLFNVPLPSSSGLTSYQMNIGSMFNSGLEFTIGADIINKSGFKWNFDVNFSTIKNEITKLPAGQPEIIQGTKKLMVGHSMYDFWLRDWYGVDQADGAALYEANRKDFATQSSNLRVIGNDTVSISQNNAKYHYAGSAIPDLMGGFTNTLSYKGIELSFLATFQLGGFIYDGSYAALMNSGTYGSALHTDMLQRWQKPGDITNVPRLDFTKTSVFGAESDRFLTDASYISLKNLTLSYTLPPGYTRKLQVQNIRIYFSGENLWLKNARKGMDPQSTFDGTTNYVYTPSRIITIGLNVTL